MIDRIRHDIQERLDQLLGEADKLRRALVALGSRDGGSASATAPDKPVRTARKPRVASVPPAPETVSPAPRAVSPTPGPVSDSVMAAPETPVVKDSLGSGSAAPRARTAPGETRRAVLAALSGGGALTAGDVAAATGLGRATVSTTLSKLAKSGEVTKAQRGYQLRAPEVAGDAGPV